LITKILSYTQYVFANSVRRKRLHPLLCIVFTIILSPIILLSSYHVVVLLLIVLALTLVSLLSVRVFFSTIIISLLIISPYIFSALIVQLIIGYYYYDVIIVNSLKIIDLVFLSTIIVFLIDEVRLISYLSKISDSLALLALLTIKVVQILLVNLDELRLVYDKNLKCSRACKIMSLLKALTYSSITDTLNIIEAFYTRKHLLTSKRDKYG